MISNRKDAKYAEIVNSENKLFILASNLFLLLYIYLYEVFFALFASLRCI